MLLKDDSLLKRDTKFLYFFCFFFFLLIWFIYPKAGHGYDLLCWTDWATHLSREGISQAYSTAMIDYHPGFLYILHLYGKLMGDPEKIKVKIYSLRLVVILFDIAGVFLAGYIFRRQGLTPLLAIFILLNIGYLYNTLIWGQVDTMPAFFAVASLAAAIYRRPVLSILLLVVSLNIKLQAIVFIPLIGILLLPQYIRNGRSLIVSLLVGAAAQFIIILPFILAGQVHNLWRVVTGAVDHYAVVSMGAFNLWSLLLEGELWKIPDVGVFSGLTYKQWGLILFCLSSAVILFPVLLSTIISFLNKVEKNTTADIAAVFLTGSLIAIGFFYFNTQMHERYSHPAVLMAAIYALLMRDYFFTVLVSFAYLLNLEAILNYLHLFSHRTVIFDPRFISGLFLISLVWGVIQLYRILPVRSNIKTITLYFSGSGTSKPRFQA